MGDTFAVHILNETITYEVDQILTVLPQDVSALAIETGRDLCTLITCTPYGVNSHRMLVRGHRVQNAEDYIYPVITAEANLVRPLVVAAFLAAPVLLGLMAWVFVASGKKQHKQRAK